MTYEWLPQDRGPGVKTALKLSGYPIRIIQCEPPDMPYKLEQDGRRSHSFMTLTMAKSDAERRAAELDEFKA